MSSQDPSQDNTAESHIQSEEEFRSRIESEKKRGNIGTQIAQFSELGKTIHENLSRQDSEKSLIIITR